jgi:methylenetetrahydrofolate reductase (NADPH)
MRRRRPYTLFGGRQAFDQTARLGPAMAYVAFDSTALAGVAAAPKIGVINLAQGFSIETTPKQAQKVESFADLLPAGSRVFVAFIPGERPQAIVELVSRLAAEGMVPVPHIAARNLLSHADFESFATALHGAGARQALLLAGGARDAAGNLSSSLELLDSGVMEGLGFEQLFVAGHPEGSPDIDAAGLAASIADKNAYARRTGMPVAIVTQFGFDGPGMLAWAQAIGEAGNRLPIRIGVAGPASLANLLKYAKLCGVNASLGMLAKAGGKLFQLVGQATPDGLITELASGRYGWAELIRDLHFYPFGGFERTAGWAASVARGAFTMHQDGQGFTVQA